MENFGLTQADSDKALELDPTYIKAYYRKGSAHMVLQKFQDALADFKKVVDALPNDKDAKKKYLECRRGLLDFVLDLNYSYERSCFLRGHRARRRNC